MSTEPWYAFFTEEFAIKCGIILMLVVEIPLFFLKERYRNWKIYQWFKKRKEYRSSVPPEEKEI